MNNIKRFDTFKNEEFDWTFGLGKKDPIKERAKEKLRLEAEKNVLYNEFNDYYQDLQTERRKVQYYKTVPTLKSYIAQLHNTSAKFIKYYNFMLKNHNILNLSLSSFVGVWDQINKENIVMEIVGTESSLRRQVPEEYYKAYLDFLDTMKVINDHLIRTGFKKAEQKHGSSTGSKSTGSSTGSKSTGSSTGGSSRSSTGGSSRSSSGSSRSSTGSGSKQGGYTPPVRRGSGASDQDYKLLGVTRQNTNDEIKRAYRQMAMRHHPDRFSHQGKEAQSEAKVKFQSIADAYERIKREKHII